MPRKVRIHPKLEKIKIDEDLYKDGIDINFMRIPRNRLGMTWDSLYKSKEYYEADKKEIRDIIDYSKYYIDNTPDMIKRGISLIYYGDNIRFITSLLSVMIMERYRWAADNLDYAPIYCEVNELMNRCFRFTELNKEVDEDEYQEMERIEDCRFLIVNNILNEKLYSSFSGRMKLLDILARRSSKGLCTILGINEKLEKIGKLINISEYECYFVPGKDRRTENTTYKEYQKKKMDGRVDGKTKEKANEKNANKKQKEGRRK